MSDKIMRSHPLASCGILMALFSCVGCTQYGDVSSECYQYAMALYSITNRQAENQLGDIRDQIAEAQNSQKISSDEAQWLTEIVLEAEQGEWNEANEASRLMLEEQIEK